MQIDLTNFGDLFGFAAAMNIVFVAADYFQSYAYILSEKVFKFQEKVKDEIYKLKNMMIDKTSINSIEPVELNGTSTSALIEKAKIDHGILTTKIDKQEEVLKEKINMLCESKTNSFISLFLSLYSVIALLLIGVYSKWSSFIEIFWIILTILSTIVVVFAWICSNPEKHRIKLCSLKHCLYLFSLLTIIACILSWLYIYRDISFFNNIIDWVYIYSELFAISNFVVYIFIINRKSKKINEEIVNSIIPLEKECKQLNDDVSSLINVNTLSNGLKKGKLK